MKILAAGPVLACFVLTAVPAASREVGQAVWVEKEVRWIETHRLGQRHHPPWTEVLRREPIELGWTLNTGYASGLAVNLFRGGMLTLGALSDADVTADKIALVDPQVCPIKLNEGKAHLVVAPGLQVAGCWLGTDDVEAVISLATDFGVWAHPRVGTLVVVTEGRVRLEIADQDPVELAAGERALVRNGQVWRDREADEILASSGGRPEDLRIIDPPVLSGLDLFGR